MAVRPGLLADLAARTEEMAGAVLDLCRIESPSEDLAALHAVAEHAAALGTGLLGRPPGRLTEEGRPALLWEPAPGGVLLLGHLDTVWPIGTLADWPRPLRDELRISAPGAFDMKAGVVQAMYAMAAAGGPDATGCGLLLTTDEELGSPVFRPLIERVAAGCSAVLVTEGSAGGALKTARKGVSRYTVRVTGRAAHAGLEPEKGVNALLELAALVQEIDAMGAGSLTVVPTVAAAGTTTNTVPATAHVEIDARAATAADQDALHTRMLALKPRHPEARVLVEGGVNRRPMEPEQCAGLLALARDAAARLDLGELPAVAVGGGSDGNFTAGIGIPTLDGLGAVGDHAHAPGEYALLAELPRRAALVAALIGGVSGR
ncbi:M20/M25/M40 family metallo-hydrolase [Phaeacidiphilus oryzae]|uniref:M20/M25/M40 family metallo-hydrolase n=1 Tax=Phaeacidiphilus oryzae TaxID=348818 RepID=UPI000A4C49BF|nr:M20/M25/M40 family metallo-hydrolase [Phaeacidiphilus oryzae]